jgi:ribosome-binding protein aMBF1 (putative translation factor)
MATTPCDVCGTAVDTEIHQEELGMCVTCSNEYYTHDDEEN